MTLLDCANKAFDDERWEKAAGLYVLAIDESSMSDESKLTCLDCLKFCSKQLPSKKCTKHLEDFLVKCASQACKAKKREELAGWLAPIITLVKPISSARRREMICKSLRDCSQKMPSSERKELLKKALQQFANESFNNRKWKEAADWCLQALSNDVPMSFEDRLMSLDLLRSCCEHLPLKECRHYLTRALCQCANIACNEQKWKEIAGFCLQALELYKSANDKIKCFRTLYGLRAKLHDKEHNEYCKKALPLLMNMRGRISGDVISVIEQSVFLYAQIGEAQGARGLVLKCLDRVDKKDKGRLFMKLAWISHEFGDMPQAFKECKQAGKIDDQDVAGLAEHQLGLGVLFFQVFKFETAVKTFEEGLADLNLLGGASNPEVDRLQRALENNLTLARERAHGACEQQLAARKEGLSRLKQRLLSGEQSEELHRSYYGYLLNTSTLCLKLNVWDYARECLMEAEKVRKSLNMPVLPETAVLFSNAGFWFKEMRDYEKASASFLYASRVIKESSGEAHPDFAQAIVNYVRCKVKATHQDYHCSSDLLSAAFNNLGELFSKILPCLTKEDRKNYFHSMETASELMAWIASTVKKCEHDAEGHGILKRCFQVVASKKCFLFDVEIGHARTRHSCTSRRASKLFEQLEKARQTVCNSITKTGKASQKEWDTINNMESHIGEFVKCRVPEDLEQKLIDHLQEDQCLAEFVKFAEPNGSEHYSAFVLQKKRPLQMVYVGSEHEVHKHIATFMVDLLRRPRSKTNQATLLDDLWKSESGQWLYTHIWKAVKDGCPEGFKHIFIAPDAELYRLPFDALPDLDRPGNFLIDAESFDISYLHAAKYLLEVPKDEPLPPKNASACVFVPSFLGDSHRQVCKVETCCDLPGSLKEGKKVCEILKGREFTTTLAEGAEANACLLKKLIGPDILHIATHGYSLSVDDSKDCQCRLHRNIGHQQDPMFHSGLMLANCRDWFEDEEQRSDQPGIITSFEIGSCLNLKGTRLVVLSACNSGRGQLERDIGIASIGRAMQLAGAHTIVVSVWQLNDEGSAHLMEAFYTEMLSEPRPAIATALRRAQRKIRREMRLPHLWASCVVYGSLGRLISDSQVL